MADGTTGTKAASRREMWAALPSHGRRELLSVLVATGGSFIGNSIHIVASALLAIELSGSAASVPLIALIGTLPPLLLVTPVRRCVRRYGGRKVLVSIDVLSTCLIATLPLLSLVGAVQLWQVYALELLTACCSAFYMPASRDWTSDIGGDESSLRYVNSALGSVMQVASVVGWGLAGVLVSALTPVGAIAVNAATFALSSLVQWWGFRGTGKRRDRGTPAPHETSDGPTDPTPPQNPQKPLSLLVLLRSVFDRSPAGRLAQALVVVVMTQRLQFSLFVVFLTFAIHVPESAIGVTNAVYSVGAAVGGALVAGGRSGDVLRRHPTAGIALFFAALAAFALSTTVMIAIPLYAVLGVLSASVVVLQTLLQDARRVTGGGDTFAALGAVQALVNMVALAALGLLLVVLPVRSVYLIVVAVCAVVTLSLLRRNGSRPYGTAAPRTAATEGAPGGGA
ncbi:MFS transporter [Streptomyces griseoviridis]|uniref:MFS transporter n=1 Tax=Streptomyces griseoviridis TaxID=45398 RepID=UPI0033FA5A93